VGTTWTQWNSGTGTLDTYISSTLVQSIGLNGIIYTGGSIKNTTRVTTTYQVLVSDDVVFCNTDAGTYTTTMPAGIEGQTIKVINTGTSATQLLLAPSGAELLLGANSAFTLNDGESLIVTYNATDGWY
jgi:hypothetical protein